MKSDTDALINLECMHVGRRQIHSFYAYFMLVIR